MLTRKDSFRFVSWKSNISIAYVALLILPLISPAGCSNEGAGGPTISSLSTPTDAPAGGDSDHAPNSGEAAGSSGEEDPVITMIPTATDVTAHVNWDHPSDIKVTGYHIYYGKFSTDKPRSEESITEESSLERLRSEEPITEESGVETLHSEEPDSCSHGESQAVDGPPATITGLEPNTRYFFAIRAFSESENLCSNEITAVTPPAES